MKTKVVLVAGMSLFLASVSLAGCGSAKEKKNENVSAVEQTSGIAYTVANRYFLKNSIKEIPSPKITTQEAFDSLFGMATVMGPDGQPTAIDFSKQYVIAVSKPETDIATELSPVSLEKNAEGDVVFTYQVTTGEKRSYSILPCLIVIVDKNNDGKVVLNEIK